MAPPRGPGPTERPATGPRRSRTPPAEPTPRAWQPSPLTAAWADARGAPCLLGGGALGDPPARTGGSLRRHAGSGGGEGGPAGAGGARARRDEGCAVGRGAPRGSSTAHAHQTHLPARAPPRPSHADVCRSGDGSGERESISLISRPNGLWDWAPSATEPAGACATPHVGRTVYEKRRQNKQEARAATRAAAPASAGARLRSAARGLFGSTGHPRAVCVTRTGRRRPLAEGAAHLTRPRATARPSYGSPGGRQWRCSTSEGPLAGPRGTDKASGPRARAPQDGLCGRLADGQTYTQASGGTRRLRPPHGWAQAVGPPLGAPRRRLRRLRPRAGARRRRPGERRSGKRMHAAAGGAHAPPRPRRARPQRPPPVTRELHRPVTRAAGRDPPAAR
jgi:hypothetical protein